MSYTTAELDAAEALLEETQRRIQEQEPLVAELLVWTSAFVEEVTA